MTFIDSLNDALSKVQDPELHRSITELGMVEELTEVKGDVSIKVLLTISGCPMQDPLRSVANLAPKLCINLGRDSRNRKSSRSRSLKQKSGCCC